MDLDALTITIRDLKRRVEALEKAKEYYPVVMPPAPAPAPELELEPLEPMEPEGEPATA